MSYRSQCQVSKSRLGEEGRETGAESPTASRRTDSGWCERFPEVRLALALASWRPEPEWFTVASGLGPERASSDLQGNGKARPRCWPRVREDSGMSRLEDAGREPAPCGASRAMKAGFCPKPCETSRMNECRPSHRRYHS